MFWQYLLTGLAFVFVFEGILPFLSPPIWRRLLLSFMQKDDKNVRTIGLISMVVGTLLMYLIHTVTF